MMKGRVFVSKPQPNSWTLRPPKAPRQITVDNGGKPLEIQYQDIFITVVGQDTTPRYVLRHGNGTSSFVPSKINRVFRKEDDGTETLVFEVKNNKKGIKDVFDHRLNMFVRDRKYHERFNETFGIMAVSENTSTSLVADKKPSGPALSGVDLSKKL